MRYVMLSWIDPGDAAAFELLSDEEKRADAGRYDAWFAKHGGRVRSAEEFGYPRNVKSLRPGPEQNGVAVADGPAEETQRFLGAFITIEAADMEEALAIASEWPTLATQPHSSLGVHPVFIRS